MGDFDFWGSATTSTTRLISTKRTGSGCVTTSLTASSSGARRLAQQQWRPRGAGIRRRGSQGRFVDTPATCTVPRSRKCSFIRMHDRARRRQVVPVPRDPWLRAGEDERDRRAQAVTSAGLRHRGVAHHHVAGEALSAVPRVAYRTPITQRPNHPEGGAIDERAVEPGLAAIARRLRAPSGPST